MAGGGVVWDVSGGGGGCAGVLRFTGCRGVAWCRLIGWITKTDRYYLYPIYIQT